MISQRGLVLGSPRPVAQQPVQPFAGDLQLAAVTMPVRCQGRAAPYEGRGHLSNHVYTRAVTVQIETGVAVLLEINRAVNDYN